MTKAVSRELTGRGAPALAQGWFYLISGVWPLVSMRSFEAVTGPKTDTWLVRTVFGLLVSIGIALLRGHASTYRDRRQLGIGAAATLGFVDLFYAVRGRIRRIYLLDGLAQVAILLAWLRSTSPSTAGSSTAGR